MKKRLIQNKSPQLISLFPLPRVYGELLKINLLFITARESSTNYFSIALGQGECRIDCGKFDMLLWKRFILFFS
jgi:hypothetical protein